MNKLNVLKITNMVLFISALTQIFTGVVLFFDLFATRARLFEMIAQTHRYNGLVLAALIVFHLALNWGWVKSQFLKRNLG